MGAGHAVVDGHVVAVHAEVEVEGALVGIHVAALAAAYLERAGIEADVFRLGTLGQLQADDVLAQRLLLVVDEGGERHRVRLRHAADAGQSLDVGQVSVANGLVAVIAVVDNQLEERGADAVDGGREDELQVVVGYEPAVALSVEDDAYAKAAVFGSDVGQIAHLGQFGPGFDGADAEQGLLLGDGREEGLDVDNDVPVALHQ